MTSSELNVGYLQRNTERPIFSTFFFPFLNDKDTLFFTKGFSQVLSVLLGMFLSETTDKVRCVILRLIDTGRMRCNIQSMKNH